MYKEAHTPWDWHKPILDRCKQHGLIGFSTPFDETAVDFLETLEVPVYKVASFEITDIPLIRRIARTKKPMIMSTGMATKIEISDALKAAHEEGNTDIVILKCTSTYPASPENTNIISIPEMRREFSVQVGLSDHTLGIGVAVASVALGATVIEKHFTLKRSDGGVDSAFSLEPDELASLVLEAKRAWQALGKVSYGATEAEKSSLQFRRSLYIVRDMKAGEKISAENTRIIRPGHGLPPVQFEKVLGKTLKIDVPRGTALSWEILL